MGGLSRKHQKILDISEKSGDPHLLLDSGNVLFSYTNPVKTQSQQAITAKGIADIYMKMGYDAVNIGPHDLGAGIPFLQNLHNIPWVCANFFTPSGEPLFPQFFLKHINDISYAILGLTPQPTVKSTQTIYKKWQDILPQLVDQLKKDADFILLLSTLDRQENEEIAGQFPDIRIIFTAGNKGVSQSVDNVGNAVITQTGNRGKYLGYLQITNPQSTTWQTKTQKSIIEIDYKINMLHSKIKGLEESAGSVQQNTDIQKRLNDRISKLQIIRQRLEKSTDEPIFRESGSYKAHHIPLTTNIPEHSDIQKLTEEIEKKIDSFNKEKRLQDQQKRMTKHFNRNLVGSAECKKCHSKQYDFWLTTAHSSSFNTLQDQQKSNDPECVVCHITLEPQDINLLPPDKSFLLNSADTLKSVGCESCHSANPKHIQTPYSSPMRLKIGESLCRNCHTPERDDRFVYNDRRPLIACPQ